MYFNETGTPKTIVFYYGTTSLFDEISLRTLYRAKNIKNSEGEAQIDDLAMSNDEKDAFNTFLKTAIYNAYEIVVKMTTSITANPVFVDATQTINTISTPNISGFRIVDNVAYNPNVLFTVDDGIFQFIRYSILASWYELVGQDNEAALWEAKKKVVKTELITKRLFQLRKPLLG